MSDQIERQAAIDAIENTDWYHQNANGDMVSGASNEHEAWYKAEDIYRALESVPSAQPEIIRCKDCRHRIVNDYYGEKLNIKGYCELDTGDPFELGRDAQNDDWFCADAERRTG